MDYKMRKFNFVLKTNMKFGIGLVQNLNEVLKEYNIKKTGIIIDQGVYNNKLIKRMLGKVKNDGVLAKVYKNSVSEPDYDYLDKYKSNFKGWEPDCLVGIGGGSTLDLTKGMAVLLKNHGPAIKYRGFPQLKFKPIPVIAIPTTAGTGSEVTYNAVFTDTKEKRKLGINSKLNYPICAILDPLLVSGCPKSVMISSGMDALTHALESFVAKNATPISRVCSKEAFKLIFNSLGRVINDRNNVEIWSNLLLGSYWAGIALPNAGAGLAGAMSYPLGAVYKVPHGLAGGMFLSSVVTLNIKRGYKQYGELYDLIDKADKKLTVEKKNKEFSRLLNKLCDKLRIPKKLLAFGINKKDVHYLVEYIFKGLKGAIEQNPIRLNKKDVRKILESMS